ncbi:MAG: hypothetical protein NVS9B15_13360 [Acidobacteriaceae bacterium]
MDIGFNPKNAVLSRIQLSQAGYGKKAAEQFERELLERVSHLPGVQAAGYADAVPLQDQPTAAVFAQETTDFRPTNRAFVSFSFDVSPGYFAAAQTPLLEGRDISFTDNDKAPAVAVVNRQFARSLFHSDHVIGRYFKDVAGHSIQIVGMVADGKYFLLSEDPQEAAFLPILQKPSTAMSLVVRTKPDASGGSTGAMAEMVRKLIRESDAAVPILTASPWSNNLGMSYFPSRVATVALGLFGAFGLLLSVTGTFGLASYTVSKRMRELSIRVALGAAAKQILAAALGRMAILLASGSVLGLLLGIATGKVLSVIVFQATAQDPWVLAAVGVTLLLTGMLAVAGPIRRVLHLDPALLSRDQ